MESCVADRHIAHTPNTFANHAVDTAMYTRRAFREPRSTSEHAHCKTLGSGTDNFLTTAPLPELPAKFPRGDSASSFCSSFSDPRRAYTAGMWSFDGVFAE
jgi:hypothetical protein